MKVDYFSHFFLGWENWLTLYLSYEHFIYPIKFKTTLMISLVGLDVRLERLKEVFEIFRLLETPRETVGFPKWEWSNSFSLMVLQDDSYMQHWDRIN